MCKSKLQCAGMLVIGVLVTFNTLALHADDISPTFAGHLQQGHVAKAETYLTEKLVASPNHGQARFALGVVKVLSAIEKLGQDQYRHGALNGNVRNLPVMRLPVPENPNPKEISYAQLRQIFLDFQTRILQAEAELAKIDLKQEVKLPLDLLSIRLDLNGDGKSDKDESFQTIFGAANRPRPGEAAPDTLVVFDNGDVPWLRGYCHFLAAFCDVVLAYDHQRMFDHVAHLVYPKPSPSVKINEPLDVGKREGFEKEIFDIIAGFHLMQFPVKEHKRMASAREHLLEMIRTSRESWTLILAETDDDHEWLPNPKQTGVLRIPVTRELIDGWQAVLVEMEDLLEGRKLVPFWRDHARIFSPPPEIPKEGRGINLKKVFLEPREFDLILTIQGSAMLPYIERGSLSHPETWDNLTQVFRGQFFGFAVWFN